MLPPVKWTFRSATPALLEVDDPLAVKSHRKRGAPGIGSGAASGRRSSARGEPGLRGARVEVGPLAAGR